MKKTFRLLISGIVLIASVLMVPLCSFADGYKEPELVSIENIQNDIQPCLCENEISVYSLRDEAIDGVTSKAYWKQFSSDFFYNKLSKRQKSLWDEIDKACLSLITTQKDLDNIYYYIDMSSFPLSIEELKQVVGLYLYANPQYYFLDSQYGMYDNYALIVLYKEFLDGKTRMQETRKFKANLDAWIADVKAAGKGYSGIDKKLRMEKEAFDLVCDELTYEYSYFDQSSYSAVVEKTTVCAGYVKSISMLLEAVGIDEIAVSSSIGNEGHVWNQVSYDGGETWYAVDATWGDKVTFILNTCNNSTGTRIDGGYTGNHSKIFYKDFYEDFVPDCTKVIEPEYDYKLAAPIISAERYSDKATISMAHQGNIYYTSPEIYYATHTGSNDPTVKLTKKYDGSFTYNLSDEKFIYACASLEDDYFYEPSRVVTFGSIRLDYKTDTDKEIETVFFVPGEKVKINALSSYNYGSLSSNWNTKDDFSGISLKRGESVDYISATPGENVTLYAKWTPFKYTVVFNGNGAESGSVKKLSLKCAKTYTLSENKFVKKGYEFAGWNTKKDGSGKTYSDKAKVKNLAKKDGAKVTLYAMWEPKEYKVTYKLNGGKNNKKNIKSFNLETKTFTLKAPSKSGYTFAGWYLDKNFKTKITKIKMGTTKNLTLYAKWKKN